MGPGTSRADLVAAAYEGIACRVAQVLRAMSGAVTTLGGGLQRLRVDGGLTASRPLMQAVADMAGIPIEISAEPEATAAGAAALAARGAGIWTSDDPIRARVATGFLVEPALSDDARGARLARFDAAVEVASRFGETT
jgi:glycerol kinase